MNQVEETDFQDGYPVFSSEGKPSKEIMVEKAREAFHTVADSEMGADWVNKPGMDLLKDSGLINAHNYKYRIMRVNSTNADVDFEALYGDSYSDSEDRDTRYYYSEIK